MYECQEFDPSEYGNPIHPAIPKNHTHLESLKNHDRLEYRKIRYHLKNPEGIDAHLPSESHRQPVLSLEHPQEHFDEHSHVEREFHFAKEFRSFAALVREQFAEQFSANS